MISKEINPMQFIKERCEMIGEYVLESGATVRRAAIKFSISKSTVHKDISYKLKRVNPSLYEDVKKVIDTNKHERHIRGGEATRRKYMKKREEKSSLLK